jgi:hypothetical protein
LSVVTRKSEKVVTNHRKLSLLVGTPLRIASAERTRIGTLDRNAFRKFNPTPRNLPLLLPLVQDLWMSMPQLAADICLRRSVSVVSRITCAFIADVLDTYY